VSTAPSKPKAVTRRAQMMATELIRSSSMVADMPRFWRTEFTDFRRAREGGSKLHVARADLENVNVTHHHLDLRRVHHFAPVKTRPNFVGGFAQELEARFTMP